MKAILAIVALLIAAPASAQSAPPPTPMEQALSRRLSDEIGASLQASATIISLQAQLAAALARIKELEPKKDEPK
jgi:hypothetical protein